MLERAPSTMPRCSPMLLMSWQGKPPQIISGLTTGEMCRLRMSVWIGALSSWPSPMRCSSTDWQYFSRSQYCSGCANGEMPSVMPPMPLNTSTHVSRAGTTMGSWAVVAVVAVAVAVAAAVASAMEAMVGGAGWVAGGPNVLPGPDVCVRAA
jgi:hypothetical protein